MRAPGGSHLVALMVAIAFLAGVIGWRIGQGTDPSADSAVIGFLQDMTTHHEQAILMSTSEMLNGEERSIKVFADEIIRFQSYELGLMERDLERLGSSRYDLPEEAMDWMGDALPRSEMPGLASEDEMALLDGGDVDAVFVSLMIDHHAAGAAMAEAAAEEVDDERVRSLAVRMARTQRSEIAELLRAADRAELTVPAAGVTWEIYDATGSAEDMTHG